jgi:hypothetical protein
MPFVPSKALACDAHLAFNPDQLGFVGGAVARMAGLLPPEPVFDLDHPAMVKADIGERSEIEITYTRPFFSKNVRLKLTGSSNVSLYQEELVLEDRKGSFTVPYELGGFGYDFITLTVSGKHNGEMVKETGRIYLRARAKTTEQAVQVTAR